jgi:hypothetical protein
MRLRRVWGLLYGYAEGAMPLVDAEKARWSDVFLRSSCTLCSLLSSSGLLGVNGVLAAPISGSSNRKRGRGQHQGDAEND